MPGNDLGGRAGVLRKDKVYVTCLTGGKDVNGTEYIEDNECSESGI